MSSRNKDRPPGGYGDKRKALEEKKRRERRPEPEPEKTKAEKKLWRWESRKCEAFTKSEARAIFKREIGGRLPVGANIVRVGNA